MRNDRLAMSLVQTSAPVLPPYLRGTIGLKRSEFPSVSDDVLAINGKNVFERRSALSCDIKAVGPFEVGMRILPAHLRDESPDSFYGELSGFAPMQGSEDDELRFMGRVTVRSEKAPGDIEFFKTEYFPLEVLRPANSFRRSEYSQFNDELFTLPLSERLPFCQDIKQVRHLRLSMKVAVCNYDGSRYGESVSGRVLSFVPNRSENGYFDFSALIVHHRQMMLTYGIQHLQPVS